MTPGAAAVALGLLVLAVFLDEAVLWFGKHALEAADGESDADRGRGLARSARGSGLLARFLTAAAFVVLGAVAWGGPGPVPRLAVLGLAVVWILGSGALVAVQWRSPSSLAGRAAFRPLRWLGGLLRGILVTWGRLPGLDAPAAALDLVRERDRELRWLLGLAEGEDPERVLATLHEFGESRVEDVMVRREEVAGIPAGASVPEIVARVREEGHSRYPVYRDSLDTVVGVLHVLDLLKAPAGATAASLARAPYFTNDTKPVGMLLRELQVTYNQMAVVVDEYGGTAGLVTVEDLLEELVGEIEDEHDEEETPIRRLEHGVYWVEGAVRVDELNEALELELEEGEYDTVAGLVLERLERVPRSGERIRENGVWLEVAAAEPHRIHALRVVMDPAAERKRVSR